ncbi:RE1, partial [Symbiodinium sp. CCMP2456]
KDVPPGWQPGLESYPLKLYFSKLKLWYRCTEVPDEVVGPLIAGRLVGRAQRIALELRLIRPDGTYDTGDAALVRLSVDQVLDPTDGVTVLQHHIPSGVQALCNALKQAFGETDETATTKSLEMFFEFRRPASQDLQEFAAEWELRFEDAKTKAGLDMNDVAKSYMWLRQANIPQRHQDDLRLQIHGDLSRFNDLRTLALRLAHRTDKSSDAFYEEARHRDSAWDTGSEWNETYWSDDGSWLYVDEDYEAYVTEDWYGEEDFDYGYPDQSESWYEDEHAHWPGDPDGEPGHQGGDEVYAEDNHDGVYSGNFSGTESPISPQSDDLSGSTAMWFPLAHGCGLPCPRYYADTRYTDQIRHAREGLHLGDSPEKTLAPKTGGAQYFNIAADNAPARISDEGDFMSMERAATKIFRDEPTVNVEAGEAAEYSGDRVAKTLEFFFRKSLNGKEIRTPRHQMHYGHNEADSFDVYHTVQGRRRRGLIIDPGAANGLIGSETLRDLMDNIDKSDEVKKSVKWSEKKSEVTGISGAADTTLGEIRIGLPMIPGMESAAYVADVVGGEASCCPALVGNPALVKMNAVIASHWFENKDGLLIVPNDNHTGEADRYHLIRLLYTDSRHYMMPLDGITDPVARRVQDLVFQVGQQARAKAESVCGGIRSETAAVTWWFSFVVYVTMYQESSFQMPTVYHGDSYPCDVTGDQRSRLDRYYSTAKEEFYSKSGKKPVTPENFHRWKSTKAAKGPIHLWELFSGSARLSYVALLAGLSVAFPVDLRYGWNLGIPAHQEMILEAQDKLDPKVIVMAPSFGSWTSQAANLSAENKERYLAEETAAVGFVKLLAERQAQRGCAFVVEQPWTSPSWKHTCLATLASDIPGCRTRQRTDQCCFGAVDEHNMPILKATGLQSNFSLRNTTRRCQGHRLGHGSHTAGSTRVVSQSHAGVFTHQLCKALIKDVRKYLKAIDCKIDGIFHADQAGRPGSSRDPAVRAAVVTPLPQLLEEFREAALRRANLDDVKVQWPEGVTLSSVDSLMFKHLLLCLVEDSVNVISETAGKHNHWSQDPVHLGVLRKVFGKVLDVKGVCVTLHAEHFPLPMPFLRTESAPFRVIIRGEVKRWTVKKAEDLRTFTQAQLKEKVFCEDWVIAVFGSTAKDKDYWEIDRLRGKATRHHIRPRQALFTPREDEGPVSIEELTSSRTTTATPYDKPGPKVVIKDEWTGRDSSRAAIEDGRWTGTTEFEIHAPADDDPPEQDPVVREANAREDDMDKAEDGEAEQPEEVDDGQAIDPPRRSNFDFRRVLVRLPRLARDDPQQAKRLLLGLHERFWHSGAGDLQTMLTRAGMPADVTKLVPETIAACAVCRRFSKLKSRPKVRANHPSCFNEEVQVDWFRLWDNWFMMVIDVATRYKTIIRVPGRDLQSALQALLQGWFRYFGPMKKLVSDQESCLMSHEAAAELERLSIHREPAGTTRGGAHGQHTTTGVVEKHTDLGKICMLKLRAEAERQGLDISLADLAAEASFAQNATLNIGGYSPHMMVIGTLPMPFYDFEAPGIQAITGAGHANPSVYERALRLRQMAITAASQSIMENRIARAGHTRPQRVPLDELQAGTSEVEFHREDADGFGWRGPALLLKLNENGSAIVEYQGRPYLIPLRNLRLFRGVYYNDGDSLKADDAVKGQELESWIALRRLMQSTEACIPFKIETFGHLRNHRGKWSRLPKHMAEEQITGILQDVVTASQFLTAKQCHGIRVGVGLKKMFTPEGSTGTLVAWRRKTVRMSIVDNPTGSDMNTNGFRLGNREEMCYIYFYSYVENYVEPPFETWVPKGTPMEESPVTPTSPEEPPAATTSGAKRDGPETRTVTLGPETKKQRIYHATPLSECMPEVFWNMHKHQWLTQLPDEDVDPSEEVPTHHYATTDAKQLFYMSSPGWHADLQTGSIFRVDSTTDSIEEADLPGIWPQVDEADHKEIGQFVNEKAFKAVRRSDLPANCAIIDGIWVRKWKKTADLKRIVKSRMCVRGCHDPWKNELNNRSSTATRLSQRLILVGAANSQDDDVESWDIAGAFLKGLTYESLWKCLRKLGLHTVERLVAIVPPRNVWRHLKKLSKEFDIPEDQIDDFVLLCLKPVYGLSEAPLAWQLFLHQFLRELGGVQSLFDECFWFWPARYAGTWPTASLTTHVDDLAARGRRAWLDWAYAKMLEKFGKLTRQSLPFMHCGCRYSRLPDGYKVDQADYVKMLKPVTLDTNDKDERDLLPHETTALRSVIGGLMWTSLTRPDVLAELSTLQSVMNKAKVQHLRLANALIERAKQDVDAAVYYRALPSANYRIVCIHDASAATATKNYAQEGVLVFLMADTVKIAEEHIVATDAFAKYKLSGRAQLLHMQSNKAKRVSYSTSHGETLAAINGLECSTLVSTRLAEITMGPTRPTLQRLLAVQEQGCPYFPVDVHTDCRDFYELTTGSRTLPQDKSQRLYIMAHREARASGRIRWTILTPTECMTADALTKVMQSPCLMKWLSTGIVEFWNTGHPLELKRLPPPTDGSTDFDEEDLIAGDDALKKNRKWPSTMSTLGYVMYMNGWYGLATMTMLATPAAGQPLPQRPLQEPEGDYTILLILMLIVIASSATAILVVGGSVPCLEAWEETKEAGYQAQGASPSVLLSPCRLCMQPWMKASDSAEAPAPKKGRAKAKAEAKEKAEA